MAQDALTAADKAGALRHPYRCRGRRQPDRRAERATGGVLDILLSQKLIAGPYLEAMLASKDDPAIQLGSGLTRYEVGLRLRYEIVKEVAPYIGVSFEQFTGATANLVAASGGATSNLRGLVGLKFWF